MFASDYNGLVRFYGGKAMTRPENIIDILIKRHEAVRHFFLQHDEVTLADDSDAEFRKVLILSIASFFEHEITNAISELAENSSSPRIFALVKAKAISRQYHTYFEWKGNNVNSFTKLFGEPFKQEMEKEIKQQEFTEGMKLFLILGQERNTLVHENFAAASISWTVDEIVKNMRKRWNSLFSFQRDCVLHHKNAL
jgi:hypothetical protein